MAGIFAKKANIWNYYRVTLKFRNYLMGGVPKDPKIIEGWLRTKGIVSNDKDLKQILMNTMAELGHNVTGEMTNEELMALNEGAAAEVAASKNPNGCKIDPEHGLYIEGRQLKAAFKESTNIAWGGVRRGPTKKGSKSYVAERVMVVEDKVFLDRMQPDGVEVITGHVTGPQGPRSTLGYTEYVVEPTITFHVKELKVLQKGTKIDPKGGDPALTLDEWGHLFTCMEEQGIGALRSMQHGRFDTLAFDPVDVEDTPEMSPAVAEAEAVILGTTS